MSKMRRQLLLKWTVQRWEGPLFKLIGLTGTPKSMRLRIRRSKVPENEQICRSKIQVIQNIAQLPIRKIEHVGKAENFLGRSLGKSQTLFINLHQKKMRENTRVYYKST